MKKSIIFLSCLLMTVFLTTTFAFDYPNLTPDEAVKQFILDHQWPNDPWEWQDPKIVGKQFFYSASDKTPSHIEYKVSCNDTQDCGSVLVNLDGTTNTITLGSFAGLAMFEAIGLTQEEILGEVALSPERLIPDPNVKYYYFTPFDAFSLNESNGEIKVNNPYEKHLEKEHMEALWSKKNDSKLAQRLNGFRELSAKTFVERVGKQENKRLESNLISRAVRATYVGSGINAGNCRSYTPCYHQGRRSYPWWAVWHTGCSPTAFSIVMGYYDRTSFPNVLEGSLAPVVNNQNIVTMQTELWDLMGTYLNENGGGSTFPNSFSQWWRYLDGKYSYSSDYHTWRKVRKIKREINAGRPAIIQLKYISPQSNQEVWHSAVVHGYQDDTLYANFWWWPNNFPNVGLIMDGDNFEGADRIGELERVDVATLSSN